MPVWELKLFNEKILEEALVGYKNTVQNSCVTPTCYEARIMAQKRRITRKADKSGKLSPCKQMLKPKPMPSIMFELMTSSLVSKKR